MENLRKGYRSLAKSLLQFCFFITFSFQFMLQDFCPGCQICWGLPQASPDLEFVVVSEVSQIQTTEKNPNIPISKYVLKQGVQFPFQKATFLIGPETSMFPSPDILRTCFVASSKRIQRRIFRSWQPMIGPSWPKLGIFMVLPSWSMKAWLVNEGILMKFKEKCLPYPYNIYIYIHIRYISSLYIMYVGSLFFFTLHYPYIEKLPTVFHHLPRNIFLSTAGHPHTVFPQHMTFTDRLER